MKLIAITKSLSTMVDDEDFEFLSQWKWHAFKGASGHFYVARNSPFDENGKRTHIFMHRIICGTPKGFFTDHIDGNTLNNQRKNLRVATKTQNMWNRAPNKHGKSRFKGVSWHKQHRKWIAAIQVNKRRKHIGLFLTEEEAGAAYAARAEKEFGEFNRKQNHE